MTYDDRPTNKQWFLFSEFSNFTFNNNKIGSMTGFMTAAYHQESELIFQKVCPNLRKYE